MDDVNLYWLGLQKEKFQSPRRRRRKKIYVNDPSSRMSSDSEDKLDYVVVSKTRESKDRKHRTSDYTYEDNVGEQEFKENVDSYANPLTKGTPNQETEDMKNRGKRVLFFKNGDAYSKGLWLSVSTKAYPTFETLLTLLNTKIDSITGIAHIFHLPEGREVTSIPEFKQGHSYVASETNKLDMNASYGGHKPKNWANEKPQAGKVRNIDIPLFSEPTGGGTTLNGTIAKRPGPRILTVVSNTDRMSVEKIILNPQTTATYEDLLQDITGMLHIHKPPVTALYTNAPPYIKVVSYSQLNRDLKTNEYFIACGEEGVPIELTPQKREQRDNCSSSNSSNLSGRNIPAKKAMSFSKSDGNISEPNYPTEKDQSIVNTSRSTKSEKATPAGKYRFASKKNSGPVAGTAVRDSLKVNVHGKSREFFPPSIQDKDDDGGKPDKTLKLEWVYGYRGKDARNNLFVIQKTGELLYFVGAIGVILEPHPTRNKQRHYIGHSEDITSMAYQPQKNLVATGQMSGKTPDTAAHIRVWDTVKMSTLAIVGLGEFQVGISSIAFSIQSLGELLLVIDDGDKHVLSVWNWQADKLIAKTPTTTDMVVWGGFHSRDDSTIITFGKKHIFFWQLSYASDVKILRDRESGLFHDEVPKFITSMAFAVDSDDVIVGDSNGSITVWSRDETAAYRINKVLSDHISHAHQKSVFALCMMDDGSLISAGGNQIKVWDSKNGYELLKERVLPENAGAIRTIAPYGSTLYIGTTKNHIMEGSLTHKFKYLIQGHSDELWGLVEHENSFFTAGYDCNVCRWAVKNHRNMWRIQVEKPCISIAIDPSGNLLVVGTVDGRMIILNAANGMHITTVQVDTFQINAVQFSPNGSLVAAGSHDGSITIYQVIDEGLYFRKVGSLSGHRGFVTHLDFSTDSKHIQSVSGDYELLYWNVTSLDGMKQVQSGRAMRDVDWHTHSCVLAYNVIGPWSNLKQGEDIDSMARSSFREYLAVGTNMGQVQLFKYPCATQKPQASVKKTHSNHVTNMCFMQDDRWLITCGGVEAALMQWTVKHYLAK